MYYTKHKLKIGDLGMRLKLGYRVRQQCNNQSKETEEGVSGGAGQACMSTVVYTHTPLVLCSMLVLSYLYQTFLFLIRKVWKCMHDTIQSYKLLCRFFFCHQQLGTEALLYSELMMSLCMPSVTCSYYVHDLFSLSITFCNKELANDN